MRSRRDNVAMVGVGAAACAACCAGPIIGFLAAIGLGTAAGMWMFGSIALALGAIALVIVLRRPRRTVTSDGTTVSVAIERRTVETHG